ncbi:MAG TPA: M28 family peptidase [Phycisphaerales bacterium]|nr:M28 family peptidase [Phycisphaerales bacterium]
MSHLPRRHAPDASMLAATLLFSAGVAFSIPGAHAFGGRDGTTVAVPLNHVAPAPAEVLAEEAHDYRGHLFFLANEFMEGRAPGTNGNRIAASYLENHFRKIGLEPAFPAEVAGEGAPLDGDRSYRQIFTAPASARPGDSVILKNQTVIYRSGNGEEVSLKPGRDFNVLGFSGPGTVEAPIAFAGYAIEEGEPVEEGGEPYTSFPVNEDDTPVRLDGKIAMVLRFEPMSEEGKSLWAETRWSAHATLTDKIDAVLARGAAGVILVNPPGADDARINQLEDLSLGFRAKPGKAPVIMMSIDAADALVRSADPKGRSLMDLRRAADERGGVATLDRSPVKLAIDMERRPLLTDNVAGVLPGRGDLAGQYIVVGAHYDHVGYGYFGSRSGSEGKGRVHPGADDNASGTSGLLLASSRVTDALSALPDDMPRRSVIFMGFSAEESGLNGSRHYVDNPIADLKQHALMLNMDMIGRLRDGKLELGGVGTGEGLQDFLQPYIESSGMLVAQKLSGLGPSDHQSFASQGVPALFFFTGMHPEYHTPADFPNTINVEGGVAVADLVARITIDAATHPKGFPFTSPTGKAAGAKDDAAHGDSSESVQPVRSRVRFGIMPGDYSGDVEGVAVGEVYPNLPAAKAGLQSGDIITEWNGKKVKSVDDWMPMLGEHKPGDKVTIKYTRKGEEFTTETTLAGRRQQE